jgi:hypothetical protein
MKCKKKNAFFHSTFVTRKQYNTTCRSKPHNRTSFALNQTVAYWSLAIRLSAKSISSVKSHVDCSCFAIVIVKFGQRRFSKLNNVYFSGRRCVDRTVMVSANFEQQNESADGKAKKDKFLFQWSEVLPGDPNDAKLLVRIGIRYHDRRLS